MKESEAKTKICPFIQNMAAVTSTVEMRNEGALAKLIDLGAAANIHCISSDCMAWNNEGVNHKDEPIGYCRRLEYEQ